ncbi:alpha/beta fold hydrolase [Rhizobium azibense]|uniref:Pimeloyl-ACP methyl ester carboxylesterase n=1 Tax=Rhizobium azibense TaxID=1136135 RepID=A0A4R3RMX7_9HYPH|nr:alpha/beta hydrolase [Rhizobium azibense]TCU37203.1 pimeloyl-ACP methyl ester carboxylesterase [Rhizobium azibense]
MRHTFNRSPNSRPLFQDTPTRCIDVGGTAFVYRELGPKTGVPVILLNHLGAQLDNFDPRIVDGLAATRWVIAFDNRGVGASGGKTPSSIAEMARDAVAFIRALGFEEIDLFGFSLGGFVAQEIVLTEPKLVRKLILAGTGPAGGEGIDKVTLLTIVDMIKGALTLRDPKYYLFFTTTENGRGAAKAFLQRLKERRANRDKPISLSAFAAQLRAIKAYGLQAPQDLSAIRVPSLVANGDHDRMVPSSNTHDLARRIPGAQLVIYADAGHGGVFQNHVDFAPKALAFLEA